MKTDSPTESRTEDHDPSRGAIIRLFGVIIIILGMLNTMLMWRGGFVVSTLYVGMISFGLFLTLIGTIRRGKGP